MSNPELLAAARRYADCLAWPVIPLVDKKPLAGSHGYLDATVDRDELVRMFAPARVNGIGVATGAAGLLVVDVDGTEGVVAWRKLSGENAWSESGPMPTVRSPGGIDRFHIYFASRDPRARSTKRGTVGPMIETKAAGSYVVVPPSRHPRGGRYAWSNWRWPAPEAPEWLLELTKPPAVSPSPAGERRALAPGEWATSYGAAALAGIVDEMRAAPDGQLNNTLHRLARRCGRLCAAGQLAEEVAREELVAAALSRGVTAKQAVGAGGSGGTFYSGFNYGLRYPVRLEERR